MHVIKDGAEGAAVAAVPAVAAVAVAVAVTYGIYAAHPWQGAPPLNQFLAAVGRADTTAWPMQIVWYAAAVAMVGLALWPARRWSSPLICALAAAYFAWIGIGYFVWLSRGTGLSGMWAGVFTLQAVLLAAADIARRDLAWALNAAPHNMATGVVVDYGMLVAALTHRGMGHLAGPRLRARPGTP